MAKQAFFCGTVSKLQSYPVFCKKDPITGTELKNGGSGPASKRSTLTLGSSDSLAATTLPAEPPPTKLTNLIFLRVTQILCEINDFGESKTYQQ